MNELTEKQQQELDAMANISKASTLLVDILLNENSVAPTEENLRDMLVMIAGMTVSRMNKAGYNFKRIHTIQ